MGGILKIALLISFYFLGLVTNLDAQTNTSSKTFVEFDTPPMIWLTDEELNKVCQSFSKKNLKTLDIWIWAQKGLKHAPNPCDSIFYEGHVSNHPKRIQTVSHLQDMLYLHGLSWVYLFTQNEKYAQKARRFLVAWAKTYRPTGNDVNENKLDICFFAYRILKKHLNPNEQRLVENWMQAIANRQQQSWTLKKGSSNRHVKRLKIILTIGVLLDDAPFKNFALKRSKEVITTALFQNGESRDLRRRKSMHYHVDCLSHLIELSLIARASNFQLYTYTTTNGASIQKSVEYVVPYAKAEKIHKEWLGSQVKFDQRRWQAGDPYYRPGKPWNPTESINMFLLATIYNPDFQLVTSNLIQLNHHSENSLLRQIIQYL